MLPGRDILTPLLDFLGTGMWPKPSNPRPSKSGFPLALIQTPDPALGLGSQQTSPSRRRGASTLASPAC